MTDGERKLRELVLLRGERDAFLSIADEEQLLETAVTQFNMSLSMAKGVMIAVAESAGFEIESDLNRVVEAMVLSLAGQQMTISYDDFEIVSKYYSQRLHMPLPDARARVKDIVIRLGIKPRRAGFLFSARWFRTIRPWRNPTLENA